MKLKNIFIIGLILITLTIIPNAFAADIVVSDCNDFNSDNYINNYDIDYLGEDIQNLSYSSVESSGDDSIYSVGIDSEKSNLSLENDLVESNGVAVDNSVNNNFDKYSSIEVPNIKLNDTNTVYVNKSYTGISNGTKAKPFKSIEQGIQNLLYGGDWKKTNLFIANGEYTLSNKIYIEDIKRKINIVGESASKTIIDCNGKVVSFSISNVSAVNFIDLTICNAYAVDSEIINCEDTDVLFSNVIFRNNKFKNSSSIFYLDMGKLSLLNVSVYNNIFDSTLSGCIIYVEAGNLNIINSSDGIILLNSSDNEISYNYISNCKNGISDLNSWDNEFDSNVLCNNNLAIKLEGCGNEYLEGNLISNNTVGILINKSSSILEYNAIFSNKNQGIIINNSEDVDLDNNWWGNNTPVLSDKYLENVSIYSNSNILFDSWLILNLDIVDFYTNTTNQKYSKIIKASLVNNLGKDVYVDNLPLLPIIFSLNDNILNSSVGQSIINSTLNGVILDYSDYLEDGIAIAELSGNYSGLINVSVILANEVLNVSTELLGVNEYPVINLKNNKKFKTIGEAINDLNTSDGDTIKIKGGYYEDNLFIYKKINLISDGEVVIVPLNNSKSTISILSDNVVLNNLTIYGGFDSQAISIFGSNVAILNCNILKSAVGLYLFESSNSSLINNTISSSDYGIYLDNSNNNSFLFNWIKDNSYGIITSNSNSNIFNSNNIFDNWVGVEESSINNSYNSNNIFDNKEGIFINDGINSSFKDNLVFDNYIGLFKYLANDSSLFLASVIENNTLANVQSFDTGDLVLQDDIWNCGPATLVNLFKIYGLNITQEEIASIAGTNSNGTSLYGLYLTCIHYGFNVSAWYLDSDSLKVNDLVVLLLDDEYHFTLIKNINETTVSLADSTFGIIDMDKDDFEDIFLGYVLELNPSSDRGLRLNINQMKNVTGNFFPLVAAGIYMGAAVIGASIGYLAYKFSSQIRSAAKWTYNHAKSIGTALVYGGTYAVSKTWQGYKYKSSKRVSYGLKSSKRFKTSSTKYKTKAPSTGYKINKELNKFLNIGSTKVNYSPSTGKYYIKGYGYSTSSKLVSKGVSSKLLAEVQYKVLYSIYTKSKTKERNKLKDYNYIDISHERLVYKGLKEYQKNNWNAAPKPPEGNQTKFLEELYKFSLKHYNKGKSLINEGHTLKGLGHIAVSAWGIDFSAVYLIYSLLPKDVFNNRG